MKTAFAIAVRLSAIGIALTAARAASGGDELTSFLRNWVDKNIDFVSDQYRRDNLIIRKQPVRVAINTNLPNVRETAQDAVARLAGAFGLSHEFTLLDPNLVIATGENVVGPGGYLTADFVKRQNLSPPQAEALAATNFWSSGCGSHVVTSPNGSIAFVFVAADTKMPADKLEPCVVSNIIAGFGMRTKGKELLELSSGYLQFLLLGDALVKCDKNRGPKMMQQNDAVREYYTSCVVKRLAEKLSK